MGNSYDAWSHAMCLSILQGSWEGLQCDLELILAVLINSLYQKKRTFPAQALPGADSQIFMSILKHTMFLLLLKTKCSFPAQALPGAGSQIWMALLKHRMLLLLPFINKNNLFPAHTLPGADSQIWMVRPKLTIFLLLLYKGCHFQLRLSQEQIPRSGWPFCEVNVVDPN